MSPVRLLVVDDSAVVRQALSSVFAADGRVQVVATAPDPYVARDLVLQHRPDVLTLDLEMPRMDGLTFLAKLMEYQPTPTVVLSSLTPEGSDTALEALRLGAVSVVCKPRAAWSTAEIRKDLIDTVIAASTARVRKITSIEARALPRLQASSQTLLAIGASTGGTTAVETVLRAMPADIPGTLITQHLPAEFTGRYADRLAKLCPFEVREARDGDAVTVGRVLIAPGDKHLWLARDGARFIARVTAGPPVNFHVPSVDVLFQSVAREAGRSAIAALLTGMGDDGARGLLAIRNAGGRTLAEDASTAVVDGMPRAARELGAAERVVPLPRIADELWALAGGRVARAA